MVVREPNLFNKALQQNSALLREGLDNPRFVGGSTGSRWFNWDGDIKSPEPVYHYLGVVHEADADYYVDKYGETTESRFCAVEFDTKEEAIEAAKKAMIFDGTPDYEKVDREFKKVNESDNTYKAKVTGKGWLKGNDFVDRYSVNIGNVIHRREARGSFVVPNDYFAASFIFNESYNKSQLFDRILNESSSLKENECSLEQLLDKAYVSEYRMVSKNSAIVRVRTTPALLTSDSMAARFKEDIPDGYKLEVEYLGEDPVLGRNLDIYEVQLLKN